MRIGFLFALLGIFLAKSSWLHHPGGFVLLWPAFSLMFAGVAYALSKPSFFCKRSTGRISLIPLVLLLPCFVCIWTIWVLQIAVMRKPAFTRVSDNLWLGRRLFAGELPAGIALVVDLTSEFPAPAHMRKTSQYICLPTLDGRAPEAQQCLDLLDRLTDTTENVYIHCAQGYGRSACLMAILFVRRGLASDVDEAIEMLRHLRPGVRLSSHQRRFARLLTQPQ